jgi:PIN domain nuclease of toxin-antitoxin system
MMISDLSRQIGLRVSTGDLDAVVNQAMTIYWTRDPFDRMIVAHAGLDNSPLLTSDERVLAHYEWARW